MASITTILMIAFGIAAVALLRKSEPDARWAKPLAGLFATITLVLAINSMLQGTQSGTKDILAAHNQYQKVLASQVSKDLLTRHPNARVTILTAPTFNDAPSRLTTYNATLLEALQENLVNQGATVTMQALEIPAEIKAQYTGEAEMGDEDMMMEMMAMESSMWFDDNMLNEILQGQKESADLVVCTMEIIPAQERLNLPPAGNIPGLVLLSGWVDGIDHLLKTTTLDSVVLYKRNADAWKPGTKAPSDPQEAFNQRYLLVTRDNVDSLVGKHPQI